MQTYNRFTYVPIDRDCIGLMQLAGAALFILLGAQSQKNSWTHHILGLYLYSTGATRQQISVLNHLGLVVSYVTLAGRGGKKNNKNTDLSSASSDS